MWVPDGTSPRLRHDPPEFLWAFAELFGRIRCNGRLRWTRGVMKKLAVSIPRIALTPAEAAAAIGVGPDFFDANVAPDLRLIRRGRKRLVPVSELERWTAENAERVLG